MSATITTSAGTLTALLSSEIETARTGRNIVHEIIGSNDPAITLRPAALRSGKLTLVFESTATALEAVDLVSAADTVTYVSENVPLGLTFVLAGDAALEADDLGLYRVVTVEYREVAP